MTLQRGDYDLTRCLLQKTTGTVNTNEGYSVSLTEHGIEIVKRA